MRCSPGWIVLTLCLCGSLASAQRAGDAPAAARPLAIVAMEERAPLAAGGGPSRSAMLIGGVIGGVVGGLVTVDWGDEACRRTRGCRSRRAATGVTVGAVLGIALGAFAEWAWERLGTGGNLALVVR